MSNIQTHFSVHLIKKETVFFDKIVCFWLSVDWIDLAVKESRIFIFSHQNGIEVIRCLTRFDFSCVIK